MFLLIETNFQNTRTICHFDSDEHLIFNKGCLKSFSMDDFSLKIKGYMISENKERIKDVYSFKVLNNFCNFGERK